MLGDALGAKIAFGIATALAGSAVAQSEYSVDQLRALYEQNRRSFTLIDINAKWTSFKPKEYDASLQRDIDFARQKLTSNTARQKLSEFLKGIGVKEVPDVSDTNQFIDYATSGPRNRLARLSDVSGSYRYIVGLDRMEIQTPWTLEKRRISAHERKIDSFTGGEYSRIQSGEDGRWTCLDPYPFTKFSNPVAWTKSNVALDTLLPPFVWRSGIVPTNDTFLAQLWEEAKQPISLGIAQDDSAALQLIGKPLENNEFLLAAFDLSNHKTLAFPIWISKWQEGRKSFAELDQQSASLLAERVEHLRSNWSVASEELVAWPMSLIYFDNIVQVQGAGSYPKLIRHVSVAGVRTEDYLLAERANLPRGWSRVGTLEISSIRASDSVKEAPALQLKDGTSFVDLDTNVGYIVGETTDSAIGDLISDLSIKSSIRWLFLVANIAAITILIVVFRIKAARRKKGASL